MSSPFVVVICHGSYHSPEPYQPFLNALKESNIESYCPQLPTSDLTLMNIGEPSNPDYNRDIPAKGYPQPSDDILVINSLLEDLVTKQGKNVILLGHSAGGFVPTAVATPELQARSRKDKGLKGGATGIFYVCAPPIPLGDSVHSFFLPKDGSVPVSPPWCKFHNHGMNGLASTVDGANYFFNELDEAQAKYYESKLTASPVLKTVLENDAYSALPCTYLVTENDMVLPAAYQEGMVALQNQREEVHIEVLKCPSGHSPYLTWKEGLVESVRAFGERFVQL
ncbi:hypothetical protein EAF04_007898 [Stromatinia cepivora]|nr:hypothetical protein EAF04_007898 [Stromatinia cepivora]